MSKTDVHQRHATARAQALHELHGIRWRWEVGDDAPADDAALRLARGVVDGLRERFARDAAAALLDHGEAAFERVWQVDAGTLVVAKLKPLAPSMTEPLHDDNGNVRGLVNQPPGEDETTLTDPRQWLWLSWGEPLRRRPALLGENPDAATIRGELAGIAGEVREALADTAARMLKLNRGREAVGWLRLGWEWSDAEGGGDKAGEGGGSETFTPQDADIDILEALAKRQTLTPAYMLHVPACGEKKLGQRLKALEAAGLVHRPAGQKSGWAITPEGRDLLTHWRAAE